MKIVEDEVKHESAVMIKEMESRAKEEADKRQRNMWLTLYRDVQQTMSLRLQFPLYSYRMTNEGTYHRT